MKHDSKREIFEYKISEFKDELKEMKEISHDERKEMKETLNEILERIDGLSDKFVTKEEFAPIKRVVYGAIGTILLSVLTALIYTVVKQ